MLRKIAFTVVGMVAIAAAVTSSPALRATAHRQWSTHFGWTEAARRADPAGFADHAGRQLARDLEQLENTRRELAAEVGQLVRRTQQNQALRDQAQTLAEEFRAQYQSAVSNDRFPIVVRNAAYTQHQTESQVSMLLAELAGYEQTLDQLVEVQQNAENQLEGLTAKISQTEAQLAVMSAKRGMLRTQQLTAEGEQLLAQLDELMIGNARVIADNPVRTVQELVAAAPAPSVEHARRQQVAEFLAQTPDVEQHHVLRPAQAQAAVEVPMTTAAPAVAEQVEVAQPAKPHRRNRNAEQSRPIFRQW